MKDTCQVSIVGLEVFARIGVYPREQVAPQPIIVDARLGYADATSFAASYIDYDEFCTKLEAFIGVKPHTALLETLAIDIALWSFGEFSGLDNFAVSIYKPKIRNNVERMGVSLTWTRRSYQRIRAASSPLGIKCFPPDGVG